MNVILLLMAAIPVMLAYLFVRDFIHRYGWSGIIVAWAIGKHLDGKRRTDARAFKRGTKGAHPHVGWWAHLSHAERALIRWLSLLGLLTTGYGLLKNRSLTFWMLGIASVVIVVLLVTLATHKVQGSYHARSMLNPLALTLSPMLDSSPAKVNDNLTVRRDYAKAKSGERVAMLALPDDYAANPAQREQVNHLISSRLGIELNHWWHTDKRPMTLEVTRAPIPPKMISFASMLAKIRQLTGDNLLLGIAGDETCRYWDIASEDPMMFISAPTRRGKTSLFKLLIAQILNHGGHVTVIDPKAVGFDTFLAGHPNAKIYATITDIKAMWNGIAEFHAEMYRRIEAYQKDRTTIFPRSTLFLDEVSFFYARSQQLWETEKTSKDKALAPVWTDIADVVYMGAAFSMNVCICGQRIDFRTLAGLIGSFGIRLLTGFDRATYMRVVGILPIPLSQRNRGRFLYYANGDEYPTWIQTVYGEDEELREFAFENVARKQGIPKPGLILVENKETVA